MKPGGLPFDVARCVGHKEWFADIPLPMCERCLRRTAPTGPRQAWMQPAPLVAGVCPERK
jgi:hypothetical protein